MTKRLFALMILMASAFLMVSCKPEAKAEIPISMMVPFGSPSLSVVHLMDHDGYLIDVVQGPDPLVSAFGSLSHDAIIAPTNLGSRMYQSKPDYLLLAVIVWGNTFLVTENPSIQSFDDLSGQDVVIFGRNQTADIVFQFLLEKAGLSVIPHYVENVTVATELFLTNPQKIVMVAEPSLSRIKLTHPQVTVIDLQERYEMEQQTSSYPQAGLFVKSTMTEATKKQLIDDLKKAIELTNLDPDLTADRAIHHGMNLPKAVLVSAIFNSNLSFRTAKESRSLIEDYFKLLLAKNPQLIGGALPDDAFYGG